MHDKLPYPVIMSFGHLAPLGRVQRRQQLHFKIQWICGCCCRHQDVGGLPGSA